MKLEMSPANRAIVALVLFVAVAVAFWMLALGPKRDEAAKLGKDVERAETSLAQHRAEVADAEAARDEFPANYRELVVLGKAAPGDDDTASLLVQVNGVAKQAKIKFSNFELSEGSGEEASGEAAAASSTTGEPVSPTEAAAALLPLGASIGSAGLGVMPYTLTFNGDFFQIADFIKGLDAMVKTSEEEVTVDGRLLTIDGFTLEEDSNADFPLLQATFAVTTYLTPPGEGVAGDADPESPGGVEAAPVATTTGAAR